MLTLTGNDLQLSPLKKAHFYDGFVLFFGYTFIFMKLVITEYDTFVMSHDEHESLWLKLHYSIS